MGSLFNTFVVNPLYNILIAAYEFIPPHDFGIAIIVATILIKLAMLHLSKKQIESQKKMQELQPKIKKIQKEHKDDKEKQTKEILALYKKHNTTPVSGCLPLIIQMIVFIAFYRILFGMKGAEVIVDSARLYPFIHNPGTMTPTLLGIIDLHTPSPLLAVLAAAGQYLQMKMMMAQRSKDTSAEKKTPSKDADAPAIQDFAEIMTKQMVYIAPVMTLLIGFTFPGGLALYWFVSTLFMIVQQYYLTHTKKSVKAS